MLVVAVLLWFLYHKLTWEPHVHRQVYDSIRPGMRLSDIENRFKKLPPGIIFGGGGNIKRAGWIEVAVPGGWQYWIYYDKHGRVTGKHRGFGD